MMLNRSTVGILLVGAMSIAAPAANAIELVPGFDTSVMPATDDYTANKLLGFTVFFGGDYNSVFVNKTGFITFRFANAAYIPAEFDAGNGGQPIIAPFDTTIDTNGPGSGLVEYGQGTYKGRAAFGVTYPSVGYNNRHTDKTNSFQVILTDRSDVQAGDFDIYFNYQQIQFESGDNTGGVDGLGGISASAGFATGATTPGTYYQFPGSFVNGALIDGGPNSLTGGTNDGIAGQYLFEVRNGLVTNIPPISAVPLPASAPMFGAALVAVAGFGYAASKRRKNAAN